MRCAIRKRRQVAALQIALTLSPLRLPPPTPHTRPPMSQSFARFVFAVTAIFFALFFLWPVFQILKGGFVDADGRLTFAYLAALLSDPAYLGGLRNSFLLACTATALALLIALPLALVSDRFIFPAKALFGS